MYSKFEFTQVEQITKNIDSYAFTILIKAEWRALLIYIKSQLKG